MIKHTEGNTKQTFTHVIFEDVDVEMTNLSIVMNNSSIRICTVQQYHQIMLIYIARENTLYEYYYCIKRNLATQDVVRLHRFTSTK